MKIYKLSILLAFSALVFSCKKDDDGANAVEIRDPQEVALENDADIVKYLETHFYNYEEFETPSEGFDYKIQLDTIAGENASKTPLMDQVSVRTINVQDVDHKLYFLVARQGVGENPHTTDKVTLTYRGNLLKGTRFDVSNVAVSFDLSGDRRDQSKGGVVRGFREFMPELKVGTGFVENGDGTITWNNDYGIGMVFIPSRLAYFSAQTGVIPPYSPIMFRIDLYDFELLDHDGDGIFSYLEDLDGDGDPFNDDTDKDTVENYIDVDDDGDGILTRFEITINEDGSVTYPDCDGDGIPDYLDKDICK